MIVGVPQETFPEERRVALIPANIPALVKTGLEIHIETGAGEQAGFADSDYEAKGAKVVASRDDLFKTADVVLQVRSLGANPAAGKADLARLRKGQVLIGFSEPLSSPDLATSLAEREVTSLSMELIPRITRAQSMDALSSMATVAGYQAVLMAAERLPRMFPMFMTAAGTIAPARIFVIGAGVAGLQAIATAKRLGGVVHSYDIRPAVKEQVMSLGAKFVELELDAGDSEDAGGYAKAMGEDFLQRQRELMAKVVAQSDVVITTAAIPGRKSPVLITEDAVKGMPLGSIIIDLAAAGGGNCELTKADEVVVKHGVTILGPTNLPSTTPYHASQMYSKNISTLLLNIVKDGALNLDLSDEINAGTLVTHKGQVVNQRIREILGLGSLESPETEDDSTDQ